MMQPILNPGMYKCAIGYVGVYDLPLLQQERRNRSPKRTERLLRTARSAPTRRRSPTQSPAKRANEIKVPVMLVHGKADDQRRA